MVLLLTIVFAEASEQHSCQSLWRLTYVLFAIRGNSYICVDSFTVSSQSPERLLAVLQENENILNGWRQISSPINQWNDDDPPATEILAARLRAKFYGAQYISCRPFLDYALHVMQDVGRYPLEQITVDSRKKPRTGELALFRAISRMDDSYIRDKARQCIRSAMNSTVALDNVAPGQRLIVTNIMGTAHA